MTTEPTASSHELAPPGTIGLPLAHTPSNISPAECRAPRAHGSRAAMQLMVAGDKWELYLPSELAYGDSGQGGDIGGGDVLVQDHRCPGRLGQQLGLAGAFHGHKQPGHLVDAAANGEQSVVAEDHRCVFAEGVGDALAFLGVVDHARVVVEQYVVVPEDAGVLGDRVERPSQ